ncbi:MAG TPA: alpha/beta fold hydrolase [Pyrinomonadaceae bacterium]
MTARKSFLLLGILFAFFNTTVASQGSIAGHWEGVMVREGAELPVSFDFTTEATGTKATFNSPTQRAKGIPLRKFSFTAGKVHFELVGDSTTIVFDGDVNADAIAGQFRENDDKGTFFIKRVPSNPASFRQEEVSFQNGDVTLSGTLLLPLTTTAHSAVVFLHGAGSEGRYGSRFLAEHFSRHGIASLIYDKRGVGKSTGDWKKSDFNDLAADAMAGIGFLKQRKEINPKHIGLYGHSQGGMLVPLIASRSRDVAFAISGAGSAVPVYESEINSVTSQIRAKGIEGAELAEASEFIKLWINVMRTGQGWEQFDPAVEKARGTKWFPLLHVPPKDHWMWGFHRRIYDYNAAQYWAQVSAPVLVIYGERDLYVPVAESIRNIDRALSRAKNPDYTILVLPRASHSFIIERDPAQPFEWWHVASGFPNLLTAWINQRRSNQ